MRQREEKGKERTELAARRRSVSGQWGKETHTAVLSEEENSQLMDEREEKIQL